MVRIEYIRERLQNSQCVCDLQVSTVYELPDMNENVGGIIILPGSIAQIIQAEEPTFLTLDDDGAWYPKQTENSNKSNLSLNASPDLNIKRESIGETTPEQTPEQIESEPILGGGKSILNPEPEYVEQPETDDLEESEVTEDER